MSKISQNLFVNSVYDKTAAQDDTGLSLGQKALLAAGTVGTLGLLGKGGARLLKSRAARSAAASARGHAYAYEKALPKVDWNNFKASDGGFVFTGGNSALGTPYNRKWSTIRSNTPTNASSVYTATGLEDVERYVKDLLGKRDMALRNAGGYDMVASELRDEAMRRLLGGLGVAGATAAGTYAMD